MKAEDYAESAALVIEECTKALKAIESGKKFWNIWKCSQWQERYFL